MSDLKVKLSVGATLDPSYQKTLDGAGQAAGRYGEEVGAITKAHRDTGDPLPGAESGYASGEGAAGRYGEEVGAITKAHRDTGDPLPGAESGYASGEGAAGRYGEEVGAITKAHRDTGDPLPGAESGYASGEAAAQGYGREVGKVADEHQNLQDEMKETAEAAKKTAQTAKDEAGRSLRETALMGAGVIYAFGRLAGGALETEEQLLNLRTVLDVDDKDAAMERALSHARDLTRRSLAGEEEILEIEYALNSAGLGEEVSRAGIELVHQVAKVTRGSAEQVGEVVGITFNNMAAGMTGTAEEKMQRIGDVLAKTQFRYQIRDFGQLGEGIAEAASAATTSQVPFETLAASIGMLNSAGQQGAEAGTAFSAVMRSMNKAAEELDFDIVRTGSGDLDLLANLALIEEGLDGLSIDERAQSLQDIFGDEGRAGIVPLLAGMDALGKGIGVMHGARGTVEEAYRPFQGSMGGQWTMLGQNVKQAGEIFAGTLLPALNRVVEPMVTVASWVSVMIEEHPQLGRLVGALAVGFGIAASALAVVSAATWVWNAALLANPLTWVVGAFIVGASLLVAYWEPVSEFFVGLWDGIKEGAQAVGESIAEFLAPVIEMVKFVTESSWAGWIAEKIGLGESGLVVGSGGVAEESGAATPSPDPPAVGSSVPAAALSISLLAGTGAAAIDTPAPSVEPNAAVMSEWQSVLDTRPDVAVDRGAVDQAGVEGVLGDARAYIDSLASGPATRPDSGLADLIARGAEGGVAPAPAPAPRDVSMVFNQTFHFQGVGPDVADEVMKQMEIVMRRASVEAGLGENDDVS